MKAVGLSPIDGSIDLPVNQAAIADTIGAPGYSISRITTDSLYDRKR